MGSRFITSQSANEGAPSHSALLTGGLVGQARGMAI